jgi:hypothetical protein
VTWCGPTAASWCAPFATWPSRAGIEDAYAKSSAPTAIRSRAEIERLFTGFDLIEPGLVHVAKWRADGPESTGRLLAGVGRLTTASASG